MQHLKNIEFRNDTVFKHRAKKILCAVFIFNIRGFAETDQLISRHKFAN